MLIKIIILGALCCVVLAVIVILACKGARQNQTPEDEDPYWCPEE